MNTVQIECFLTLSETLNFTKAAEQLYMSQPSFSRQISTLERDINCLLFIRNKQTVRLTPAGVLLARELGALHSALNDLVNRVQSIGHGYTGVLTVGVLEGHQLYGGMPHLFRSFMEAYPNIDFRIIQGSFGFLRDKLFSREIDIALTLDFDIKSSGRVVCRNLEPERSLFVISKGHPLAQKETITPHDIAGTTMILLSPDDCRTSSAIVQNFFREKKAPLTDMLYAPDLGTAMLWAAAGRGVTMVSSRSILAWDPNIRMITEVPFPGELHSCMVWLRDNMELAIPLFDEVVDTLNAK